MFSRLDPISQVDNGEHLPLSNSSNHVRRVIAVIPNPFPPLIDVNPGDQQRRTEQGFHKHFPNFTHPKFGAQLAVCDDGLTER